MRLRVSGMTAGLAVGITAAVVGACGTAAYVYSLHHFDSLLETARSGALAQGELMRAALEHQMMENDRTLIARMVETFGRQPRIDRVLILDRAGQVRFASAPPRSGHDLALDSPTCQACHRLPADQRSASRVIDTPEGALLRTVIPVRNRAECHRCHDPAHRMNGILLVDVDPSEIRAAVNSDLRWMAGGGTVLTLGLIVIIALVVRIFVLRRLQRFETAARQIAAGDLARRVPERGSDTVAWLAREFNTMADSVTGLVTEVRDQRQRLETVINSIDDGIVVLDAQRTVIAANEAFIQRTGARRSEVLGCSCGRIADGMCAAGECPTVACLETGRRQVRVCERVRPEGTRIYEEVHASAIRGPSGTVTQVVEVWRDITDRRAAEARLAESHRLASLGMLASGFSHEMNTPLATVLACVEGILRETRTDPVDLACVGDHAATAREQLLRCRGVTQHFLRMSRGQAASGDIIDLGAAMAAVARLVAPVARESDVVVDAECPPGIHVRGDEADLQHALMNLLLNAIQASRRGGRVTARAAPGDPVAVRVADEGCGIAAEDQQRIFEPFFSLRKGGTGLGLFLSLNALRRWGGDITVSSVAGVGSTFEIRIPAPVIDMRQTA